LLTVRYRRGIIVEYGYDAVAFDPMGLTPHPAFISHAHADHSAAFKHSDLWKYSTEETLRLVEALGWGGAGGWRELRVGGSARIGEIEVRGHNAGHVLGSLLLEASTPEGTILYTGDFNVGDSYTMEAAEGVDCDLLVIETTFASPVFSFPSRREIALEMVRWAVFEVIPMGRTPIFRTDPIGNAQEIIIIFNRYTRLPVLTQGSVTRASDIYRTYGFKLDYVDARSEEGEELLEDGRCILVAPKGSKLSSERLEPAIASGWAAIMRGRRSKPFPLSDHSDFRGILRFIRSCKPKKVLTFHGTALSRGFPEYLRRKLGVEAYPLTARGEGVSLRPRSEERIRRCCEHLLLEMRAGFIYRPSWLMRAMALRGYSRDETQEAIERLIEREILERGEEGIRLRGNA
jgi:putative mRNA 3-end processing factor